MLRTNIVFHDGGTTLCTKERVDRPLIQSGYAQSWFRERERLVFLVQTYTVVNKKIGMPGQPLFAHE